MGIHTFVKHENCERPSCVICDGGLQSCEVCKGAESSLPTDCPGARMTADQFDAVTAGRLDYRSGGWVFVVTASNLAIGTTYEGTTPGTRLTVVRAIGQDDIEVKYAAGPHTGRVATTTRVKFAKWATAAYPSLVALLADRPADIPEPDKHCLMMARMVAALRQGLILTFGAPSGSADFWVGKDPVDQDLALLIKTTVSRRGRSHTTRPSVCWWTLDDLYREAAILEADEVKQLPELSARDDDPLVIALKHMAAGYAIRVNGIQFCLRTRTTACTDGPDREVMRHRPGTEPFYTPLNRDADYASDVIMSGLHAV